MDSLMWTPATRALHNRAALRFATDLTDQEFAVLEPLFQAPRGIGRPPTPLREILQAIFYLMRAGCPSPSISSWAGPEFGQRQGFEQEFHELSQSPGEPGEFASGDLAGLTVGGFFSAGAGFSAWSHMPVETAQ